ncbi:MAG: chemotaxis protein CheX [Candidatus Hydrogenedentes bacterium]|nr:chemotaxis protein CheX [Candidatus Hydrogenedentota bacterium]
MDVSYVNPFIESVQELFSAMLGCEATRGDLSIADDSCGPRDITAIIGLSGPTRSTVVLTFPTSTALAVSGRLIGSEVKVVDDTVSDTVGELVNMVAGSAKAKLHTGDGEPVELSLPTVVRGNNYVVGHPKGTTCLNIPFSSELGEFSLRISVQQMGKR